ncbi:zinc-binding loop region of homing endonuclease-domain-containing protein [Lipomyces starkeyi]
MCTSANFDAITPTKANKIVKGHHHKTTSLGCWESIIKHDRTGYPRVCLSTGGKRFYPRLHQLVLIADNRREELKATLGSHAHDVSHLCHNRRCFNPEHLIVESRQSNSRRRTCNGHTILVGDGFSYHPCAHGTVEKMLKCILPVQHLQVTMPNGDAQPSTEASPAPNPDDITTVSNNADTNAGKLGNITPVIAQQLINKYRVVTTDLGCWHSTLKPDKFGNCRVDLRHLHAGRPLLHQLALVADNRGAELEMALGQSSCWCVSHLCHNHQCFSPQHLIVESRSDHRKRNACKGKTIVVHGGFTDHSCVHGSVGGMHKCILPVQNVPDTMSTSDEQPSTETTPLPDLHETATGNNDGDANKYDHITPTIAQELIDRYHVTTTAVACWESNVKPCNRAGHCRVQLRKLDVHPCLHQLALIADNRGAELKTTLRGRNLFDVSHLCHNGLCFNPEHLIVESRQNNLRRRTCVGHNVVFYGDFEHHPCRHGEVEKMRKCILPLLRLGPGDHVNGSE